MIPGTVQYSASTVVHARKSLFPVLVQYNTNTIPRGQNDAVQLIQSKKKKPSLTAPSPLMTITITITKKREKKYSTYIHSNKQVEWEKPIHEQTHPDVLCDMGGNGVEKEWKKVMSPLSVPHKVPFFPFILFVSPPALSHYP